MSNPPPYDFVNKGKKLNPQIAVALATLSQV